MNLLDRKRVGLILRVFSPKPELVERNVEQIIDTLDAAHQLEIGNKYVFSRVDVLVSADSRYGDTDCGGTKQTLEDRLRAEKNKIYADQMEHDEIPTGPARDVIYVSEIRSGDIFCGMLNYGIASQLRNGIDYSMILSIGVKDYLTVENMQAMLDAIEAGALVAGLAITELAPSIFEGRVANTCAIWDNVALMTVGGFDLMARKAKIGETRPNAGVEEIPPLIRLVEHFGPCITPVVPANGGQWVVSDDPDVKTREWKKLASKFERQQMHATALSVPDVAAFLKSGIRGVHGV